MKINVKKTSKNRKNSLKSLNLKNQKSKKAETRTSLPVTSDNISSVNSSLKANLSNSTLSGLSLSSDLDLGNSLSNTSLTTSEFKRLLNFHILSASSSKIHQIISKLRNNRLTHCLIVCVDEDVLNSVISFIKKYFQLLKSVVHDLEMNSNDIASHKQFIQPIHHIKSVKSLSLNSSTKLIYSVLNNYPDREISENVSSNTFLLNKLTENGTDNFPKTSSSENFADVSHKDSQNLSKKSKPTKRPTHSFTLLFSTRLDCLDALERRNKSRFNGHVIVLDSLSELTQNTHRQFLTYKTLDTEIEKVQFLLNFDRLNEKINFEKNITHNHAKIDKENNENTSNKSHNRKKSHYTKNTPHKQNKNLSTDSHSNDNSTQNFNYSPCTQSVYQLKRKNFTQKYNFSTSYFSMFKNTHFAFIFILLQINEENNSEMHKEMIYIKVREMKEIRNMTKRSIDCVVKEVKLSGLMEYIKKYGKISGIVEELKEFVKKNCVEWVKGLYLRV